MALLTARHATGRDRFVVFDHAYHGGPLYFGHGGEAAAAAVRLARAAVQRRRRCRADRHRRSDRRRARRTDARRRAAASPATPTSSPRCGRRRRRPATVLIFDEVMTSRLARRRRPGAARDHAGPDHPRQVPRRRALASAPSAVGATSWPPTTRPSAASPTAARSTTTPSRWPSAAAVHARSLDAEALAAVNERGDRLRAGLNARFAVVAAAVHAPPAGARSSASTPSPARCARRPTWPAPTRAGGSCSSTTSCRPGSTSRHAGTWP